MLINTVGGIGTEQNHNQNKVHSKGKKRMIGIEGENWGGDKGGDDGNKKKKKKTFALPWNLRDSSLGLEY